MSELRRRDLFFWWWPSLGFWASLWYGPRYYWEWCLPQRDHWHIGPLSFYYTRKIMDKAGGRVSPPNQEEA